MNEKDGYWKLKVGLLLISVILLIIVTSLIFVPPASALTVLSQVGGTVGTDAPSITYTDITPATDAMLRAWNIVGLSAEVTTDLSGITSISTTTNDLAVPASGSTDVDFYVGANKRGSGFFTWSRNTVTGKTPILMTINSLDITGLPAGVFINFSTKGVRWDVTPPVVIAGTHNGLGYTAGASSLRGSFSNDYSSYTTPDLHHYGYVVWFKNSYTITQYTNYLNLINVSKLVNSETFPSRIRIFSYGNTVIYDEGSVTANNFSLYTMTVPLGVSAQSNLGYFYNSSLTTDTSAYNLSVTPNNIPPSGSSSGIIYSVSDSTLSNINAVIWTYTDEFGDHLLTETNPGNLLNYGKIGGTWYGFNLTTDGFTNNKGASIPNPVTISIPTTGLKTIHLQISTTSGKYQSLTAPLQIGDANTSYTRTNVVPQEFLRGNLVTNAIVSFKSVLTGTWTNITVDNWGQATISSQPSQYYDVYANAPGYLEGSRLGIITSGYDVEQTYIVYMYPLNTTVLAGGKTILYVSLIDGSTLLPITTGAVVAQTAYESSFYTKQIVNSAGIATLYVPNNTKLYVFTEDLDVKYKGRSTYFETGPESMDEIDWVLEVIKAQPTAAPTIPPGVQQPGAAPGVTIAPGQTYAPGVTYTWAPTPTYLTPQPTTTLPGYQPQYGNFTGFWAPFENMGVSMGARPSEVGVLMMFMLIIGFLILGGWAAGPLGAEVGVVAGMVCSVAFGFLPFAISIAVIAILCLYGALRIWGVTR